MDGSGRHGVTQKQQSWCRLCEPSQGTKFNAWLLYSGKTHQREESPRLLSIVSTFYANINQMLILNDYIRKVCLKTGFGFREISWAYGERVVFDGAKKYGRAISV